MISIILITPESIPTTPTILHPNPGGYMISKEVETYRAHFSNTIETLIEEKTWNDIMLAPYSNIPKILEKLAEDIRKNVETSLKRNVQEKLAA